MFLEMMLELIKLLLIDAFFLALLIVPLLLLRRFKPAAFAVLKRNFVGYFSNPTGYVFLCLFVLLTSMAAFFPHEFFTANLANLDQLNGYIPFIMVIFIPAITMSIWAEERRQGTDELLLTMPANDFDIVIGKYLAAAAIFTASLLFSQLSNYSVLVALSLGDLDTGLLFATYFGYWMIGLAMLALGMVASFLTSNITVGFILGALLNAPLVVAVWADTLVPWSEWARWIAGWSISSQFAEFGRGVIGLPAISYFAMLIVLGLYVSMVLIGRRHWVGGRDGHSLLGHYVVRILALAVITLGVNSLFVSTGWLRFDVSDERIASLSPETYELLDGLGGENTIYIDAFLSGRVPEAYAQTRLDLLSMLREFQARSSRIRVRIHDNLEPFSEEVNLAEEQFGIRPQNVRVRAQGAIRDEQIILAAAFTSGLERVVVPFFDAGMPVEYELIRSIITVSEPKRKRLGVVRTDAQMFGGFSFQGMQPMPIPRQELIDELQKQYEVEEVDPNEAIEDKYDALLVVQPSSLTPPQFENLLTAIRSGMPTALFEDPLPEFLQNAVGTSQPKRPQGGMFGGGQAEPKGEIARLWDMLGIEVLGTSSFDQLDPDLVWDPYMPYSKIQLQWMPDQWLFIRSDMPGVEEAFNGEDPVTAGIDEVLFPVASAIRKRSDSKLNFTPLVKTGTGSGTIAMSKYVENRQDPMTLSLLQGLPGGGPYTLAARITGDSALKKAKPAEEHAHTHSHDGDDPGHSHDEAHDAEEEAESESAKVNVIYVTDIDLLHTTFLRLRNAPDEEISWQFENVTFALNVIDSLAGEDRFLEIRKRKTRYSTLQAVERHVAEARAEEAQKKVDAEKQQQEQEELAAKERREAVAQFQKRLEELQAQQAKGETVDPNEMQAAVVQVALKQQVAEQREAVAKERLRRERNREIERVRYTMDLRIRGMQNQFKLWAVMLPPIPPLLVALVVFTYRRLKEREGVSKKRLR